ncbi:MAG TPA: hypothetical protein VKS20_04835 [Candidatus Acidoferrales bacterium]|nr:hypothetical protein [Candidatus Acidoferrales bacterium]
MEGPRSQFVTFLSVPALAAIFFLAAFANPQAAERAAKKPVPSSTEPTLIFQQIFKSSYPEYVQITVNEDGKGTWDIRQLDDTASPQPMQIEAPLVQKMFALAEDLHDFQGVDLDVHRRIANLGRKTFFYKNGAQEYQVTFNYTVNSAAQQLLMIFDGLQRQELDLSDMQRVVRYDHLGVNDVILRVQNDVKRKLIPEPTALLPALDEIAANSELIDMSRERARAIAEQIRQGESKN